MGSADQALARIAMSKARLLEAVAVGCRDYANGAFGARPGVAAHFTAGNAGRYGWAPLSPGYAAEKAGATPVLKADMKAAKRAVPKGKGLPVLVLTGALRDAITAGRAVISRTGDRIRITWTGLPDYATYLHNGTPRMPARSPINPNEADRNRILAAARRFLSAATGTGGAVPVGGAPGAVARVRR